MEFEINPRATFVAIDFETLYPQHESVCAVGMVKYQEGVVLGQFYSLIKPPNMEWFGRCCSDIHGIDPTMLQNAPSFVDIFPQIMSFVGEAVPVAHNASMERSCFEKCCFLFGLRVPEWIDRFEDTYVDTGMKLVDACKEVGIETARHHDPLQDAMMCALLHMHVMGLSPKFPAPSETARQRRHWSTAPKFHPDDLIPLPAEEVKNPHTPFFQTSVVYTGVFSRFPDRCQLGSVLKDLGARIEANITRRTKLLLCGENPGPKKVCLAKDRCIPIMDESELYGILDSGGQR